MACHSWLTAGLQQGLGGMVLVYTDNPGCTAPGRSAACMELSSWSLMVGGVLQLPRQYVSVVISTKSSVRNHLVDIW